MKKTIIVSLLAAVFSIVGLTGCSTTNGNPLVQINPKNTSAIIAVILPPAVKLSIEKEPQSRQWIQDVQVAVCALSDSTNVTPAALQAAFNSTGVKELETPTAEASAQAVYGIYSAYYADVMNQFPTNATVWLSPVLDSICNGLTTGLAESPAPAVAPSTPSP